MLYYQPKLDISCEKITGTEALLRWQHPKLGVVPPAQIIPMAEKSGLIKPISEWVLRTACAQNVAWQAAGYARVRVAVNLSSLLLKQRKLVEIISQVLDETGMAPDCLEIELTESTLIANEEEAIRALQQLKAMRVRVSLDDFGTGYSCLWYLKRYPLDAIKIDRSFVKDVANTADSRAIATGIIAMAHSLQLSVTAEGVETELELGFLREQGCDEMQGFLFSPPVPSNDIDQLLLAGSI
jgi:EAL domain-containing protein (putative c-di-GMP-specific phosphodiesterase class I)